MPPDFLSELERLDDHLRAQGSGVVQLLDQLARQAHGLAALPPLGVIEAAAAEAKDTPDREREA